MITLYSKDFATKYGTIDSLCEAFVEEERNGLFELSFIMLNTDSLFNYVKEENIVVVNANDTLLNQKFRIYMTRKLMNNRVEVFARHISFDLMYDYIDNVSFENQSCEYALNQLFRNSNFSKHYRGYSDIVNAQNYSMTMANVLEAIGGKQGSIIDTFGTGAEILRDNENIHVLNKRGYDNEVTIEYKKNLTGFELEEDTTDLVTRILPYAKYNDENNGEIIVKADYVDSPLIANYSHPYIASIDYSDKFENDEIPTISKLQELARKEYRDNKVDIPKQNFKIEFIPLSKCVGYDGLEDKISLCDIVTIVDTRYNIRTQSKVIKTVYNVLKNRYESIELGEPKTSLGNIIGNNDNLKGEKGEKGDKGDKGDKGEDGNIGDFPNSLPATPVVTATVYGFANIEISWTFENKVYYQYEVYASKEADFTPNTFNLIHQGQTSTFTYQAKPNETWYFKVCCVNTHGERTSFGSAYASTKKVDDLSNYVSDMAIDDALIGTLRLDRGWIGTLRGNYIDAKQLSVTDGNGRRTLDIDSFGNVNIIANDFKVMVDGSVKEIATKSQLQLTSEALQLKFENSGGYNLIRNGGFEDGMTSWNTNKTPTIDTNNPWTTYQGKCLLVYYKDAGEGIFQLFDTIIGETYSYSCYVYSDGDMYVGIEDGHTQRVTKAGWNYITGTFVATSNTHGFVAYGYAGNGAFYIDNVCVCLGASPKQYTPHPDEIHSANITINEEGLTVKDGAISIANKSDQKMLYADLNGNLTFGGNLKFENQEDPNRYIELKQELDNYGELESVQLKLSLRGDENSRFKIVYDDEGIEKEIGFFGHGGFQANDNITFYSKDHIWYWDKSGQFYPKNNMTGFIGSPTNRFARVFTESVGGARDTSGVVVEGYHVFIKSNFDGDGIVFDEAGAFRPVANGDCAVGATHSRFGAVYTYGVDIPSDRRLKENIKYISETYKNKSIEKEITSEDIYNFVKDDLKIAIYNYKDIQDEDEKSFGFVAQDIEDTKVSSILLRGNKNTEGTYLSYDLSSYVSVLANALSTSLNKIEVLENRLNEIESR